MNIMFCQEYFVSFWGKKNEEKHSWSKWKSSYIYARNYNATFQCISFIKDHNITRTFWVLHQWYSLLIIYCVKLENSNKHSWWLLSDYIIVDYATCHILQVTIEENISIIHWKKSKINVTKWDHLYRNYFDHERLFQSRMFVFVIGIWK